jgi:DNA-binding PadR family transcriptional regulator
MKEICTPVSVPVQEHEGKRNGSIELIVLTILKEQSRHGYDIGRLIEIRSQGQLQFRITSLYPVLYRMENRGWIKSRSQASSSATCDPPC